MKALVGAAFAASALLGCSDEVPALGEALVVVDTDLPVPQIVSRLRVDLYTLDGDGWYVSREIPTLDASDWPVSFSVFNPDERASRGVILRLRAYPAGAVRDYRGERYTPRPPAGGPGDPSPVPAPPPGETPRLFGADGTDVTPLSEPQPWVTVDRLVHIHLVPGERGSVRVVLRGACAGTMADLENGTTCIDESAPASPIPASRLDDDMTTPASTTQGTFGAEHPCTADVREPTVLPDGTPLFDDEVCVPGRIFVFGSVEAYGRGERSDLPQRIAILPPFRMDRFEVTVGRWRAALAAGFVPPSVPAPNEGPIDFTNLTSAAACTWSAAPMGRETWPMTCLHWQAASAFCAWAGGELPSEVQWEYVAMDAGRDVKTRYPWGNQVPTCERAIFARQVAAPAVFHATDCNQLGYGLGPVDAVSGADGDVAHGTGLVNLAGSVSEANRDAFSSFESACWASQDIHAPACLDPASDHFAMRGGNWASNTGALAGDVRDKLPRTVQSPLLGFRCVRSVP